MKSTTVFSIAPAAGLTFAAAITAFAHYGWFSAPERAAIARAVSE